jgi:hypothetical protein
MAMGASANPTVIIMDMKLTQKQQPAGVHLLLYDLIACPCLMNHLQLACVVAMSELVIELLLDYNNSN